MKSRKTTPEWDRDEWRRQWAENSRRIGDYLDQAWDELEERARREGRPLRMERPERPVWAGPPAKQQT